MNLSNTIYWIKYFVSDHFQIEFTMRPFIVFFIENWTNFSQFFLLYSFLTFYLTTTFFFPYHFFLLFFLLAFISRTFNYIHTNKKHNIHIHLLTIGIGSDGKLFPITYFVVDIFSTKVNCFCKMQTIREVVKRTSKKKR